MIPTIEHVERWADPYIDGLLDEEPAILLEGPRGSGKSTLAPYHKPMNRPEAT